MDISFTLENLAALKQAIATGAISVQYGDKVVRYRNLSSMLAIKDIMEDELGISRTRRTVGNYISGKH